MGKQFHRHWMTCMRRPRHQVTMSELNSSFPVSSSYCPATPRLLTVVAVKMSKALVWAWLRPAMCIGSFFPFVWQEIQAQCLSQVALLFLETALHTLRAQSDWANWTMTLEICSCWCRTAIASSKARDRTQRSLTLSGPYCCYKNTGYWKTQI